MALAPRICGGRGSEAVLGLLQIKNGNINGIAGECPITFKTLVMCVMSTGGTCATPKGCYTHYGCLAIDWCFLASALCYRISNLPQVLLDTTKKVQNGASERVKMDIITRVDNAHISNLFGAPTTTAGQAAHMPGGGTKVVPLLSSVVSPSLSEFSPASRGSGSVGGSAASTAVSSTPGQDLNRTRGTEGAPRQKTTTPTLKPKSSETI